MPDPSEEYDRFYGGDPARFEEPGAFREFVEHCQGEALKPLLSEREYDALMAKTRAMIAADDTEERREADRRMKGEFRAFDAENRVAELEAAIRRHHAAFVFPRAASPENLALWKAVEIDPFDKPEAGGR